MLDKLKQLLRSAGSTAVCPSGLCLWRRIGELEQLADELAAACQGETGKRQIIQETAQGQDSSRSLR